MPNIFEKNCEKGFHSHRVETLRLHIIRIKRRLLVFILIEKYTTY